MLCSQGRFKVESDHTSPPGPYWMRKGLKGPSSFDLMGLIHPLVFSPVISERVGPEADCPFFLPNATLTAVFRVGKDEFKPVLHAGSQPT